LFTKRGHLQKLATFTHPQVLVIDEVGMKARYRISSNVVMVLAVTRQLKWRESLCPFPNPDSRATAKRRAKRRKQNSARFFES